MIKISQISEIFQELINDKELDLGFRYQLSKLMETHEKSLASQKMARGVRRVLKNKLGYYNAVYKNPDPIEPATQQN